MSGAASKLVVLLDEGTPVMAADAFLARGHEVIFHADVLDSGADDDEVVIAAISNRAVS